VTDFAPDAVLSFFEQRQRAKERRARLWGKPAPRRVNTPMQEPEVRSEPVAENLIEVGPSLSDSLRAITDLAVKASPLAAPTVEPAFPRVRFVAEHVAALFAVSMVDLNSARREARIVRPRQVAMYLARRMTLCSLPQIGKQLGGKDHTTVLHGAKKIEAEMAGDRGLSDAIAELTRRIDARLPVVVLEPPKPVRVARRRRSLYVAPTPKRVFWDENRTAEFIRLWHAGTSSDDLAERYGRDRTAINKHGRKLGLPPRRSGRKAKA
jgi:hypothetical protein